MESLGTRPDWETYEEYGHWLRPQLKGLMVVYLAFLPIYFFLLNFSWPDYVAWVVIMFGSSVATDFMVRALEDRHTRPRIVSRRWFFSGVIVVYVALIINSLISSVNEKPSLPYATTDSDEVPKGMLVTHSDGYWYVFDEEGQLRAIPDADAGAVQVSSEPTTD